MTGELARNIEAAPITIKAEILNVAILLRFKFASRLQALETVSRDPASRRLRARGIFLIGFSLAEVVKNAA
jgi:hypothetical protein